MNSDFLSKLKGLCSSMKGQGAPYGKNIMRTALLILVLFVFIVMAVTLSRLLSNDKNPLAMLPPPDESSPYAMITISDGELPAELLKLLLDSPTIFPSGNSPIIALFPVFKTAERSALVITERDNNFVMYGNLNLKESDYASFSSLTLPKEWESLFVKPKLTGEGKGGLIEVTAENLTSPLYIELHEGVASVADSLSDIDKIREIRAGTVSGVKEGWKLNSSWGGHLVVSDGGIISALLYGSSDPVPQDRVGVEVAWKSGGSDLKPHAKGELVWKFRGLDKRVGSAFSKSLKSVNWDAYNIFIPSPALISMGINLPKADPNEPLYSSPLKSVAERIIRLGLNEDEARTLLSGPSVLSLGGMTQLLWFELPGAALDIFDRGQTSYKLIDAFWTKLFMGADPKPIPGYSRGGTTDLPFPIVAACNDKSAVIALSAPDMERDEEIKRLLKRDKSSIGWFYADLPKLGAAIANMPSMSALLSESEDTTPTDTESMELLRESLDKLSKLFVVWESGDSGYGVWYR